MKFLSGRVTVECQMRISPEDLFQVVQKLEIEQTLCDRRSVSRKEDEPSFRPSWIFRFSVPEAQYHPMGESNYRQPIMPDAHVALSIHAIFGDPDMSLGKMSLDLEEYMKKCGARRAEIVDLSYTWTLERF